jgi:hypothetical protein
MAGDPHMQMAVRQPPKPGDEARAAGLIEAARQVARRYADVRVAERDGYRQFGGKPRVSDEVHYVSVRFGHAESKALNPLQPGSLLYRATPQGMEMIGAMYSAPGDATPQELDARAPLSIAHWHRHVDFCGAPVHTPAHESEGPGARYGFQGSIHTEAECARANGLWIPLAFGWMAHVYPNADPASVWGGEHMKPGDAGTGHHH